MTKPTTTTQTPTKTDPDDVDLSAASTEHLNTRPDSEVVVGTPRREPADDHDRSPTERFRRTPHMRPVGIDVLPTAD